MEALTKIGEFFFDDGTLDDNERMQAYSTYKQNKQQLNSPAGSPKNNNKSQANKTFARNAVGGSNKKKIPVSRKQSVQTVEDYDEEDLSSTESVTSETQTRSGEDYAEEEEEEETVRDDYESILPETVAADLSLRSVSTRTSAISRAETTDDQTEDSADEDEDEEDNTVASPVHQRKLRQIKDRNRSHQSKYSKSSSFSRSRNHSMGKLRSVRNRSSTTQSTRRTAGEETTVGLTRMMDQLMDEMSSDEEYDESEDEDTQYTDGSEEEADDTEEEASSPSKAKSRASSFTSYRSRFSSFGTRASSKKTPVDAPKKLARKSSSKSTKMRSFLNSPSRETKKEPSSNVVVERSKGSSKSAKSNKSKESVKPMLSYRSSKMKQTGTLPDNTEQSIAGNNGSVIMRKIESVVNDHDSVGPSVISTKSARTNNTKSIRGWVEQNQHDDDDDDDQDGGATVDHVELAITSMYSSVFSGQDDNNNDRGLKVFSAELEPEKDATYESHITHNDDDHHIVEQDQPNDADQEAVAEIEDEKQIGTHLIETKQRMPTNNRSVFGKTKRMAQGGLRSIFKKTMTMQLPTIPEKMRRSSATGPDHTKNSHTMLALENPTRLPVDPPSALENTPSGEKAQLPEEHLESVSNDDGFSNDEDGKSRDRSHTGTTNGFMTAIAEMNNQQVETFQLMTVDDTRSHSLRALNSPRRVEYTQDRHQEAENTRLKSPSARTESSKSSAQNKLARSSQSFAHNRSPKSLSNNYQQKHAESFDLSVPADPIESCPFFNNVKIAASSDATKSVEANGVEISLSGAPRYVEEPFQNEEEVNSSSGIVSKDAASSQVSAKKQELRINASDVSKATSYKTSEGVEVDPVGVATDCEDATTKYAAAFIAKMSPRSRKGFFAKKIKQLQKAAQMKSTGAVTEEAVELTYDPKKNPNPKVSLPDDEMKQPEFMERLRGDRSELQKNMLSQEEVRPTSGRDSFINSISEHQLETTWGENDEATGKKSTGSQDSKPRRGRSLERNPPADEDNPHSIKVAKSRMKSMSKKLRRSLTPNRGRQRSISLEKKKPFLQVETPTLGDFAKKVRSLTPTRGRRRFPPDPVRSTQRNDEFSNPKKKWRMIRSFSLPRQLPPQHKADPEATEDIGNHTIEDDNETFTALQSPAAILSMQAQDGAQAITPTTKNDNCDDDDDDGNDDDDDDDDDDDIGTEVTYENPWHAGYGNFRGGDLVDHNTDEKMHKDQLSGPEAELTDSIKRGMASGIAEPAEGEDEYYKAIQHQWKREQLAQALAMKIAERKRSEKSAPEDTPVVDNSMGAILNKHRQARKAAKAVTFGDACIGGGSMEETFGSSTKKSKTSMRKFASGIKGILRKTTRPRKGSMVSPTNARKRGQKAHHQQPHFGFESYDDEEEDSGMMDGNFSVEEGFLLQHKMMARSTAPLWSSFANRKKKHRHQKQFQAPMPYGGGIDPPAHSSMRLGPRREFYPPHRPEQQSKLQRVLGKRHDQVKARKRIQSCSDSTSNSVIDDYHRYDPRTEKLLEDFSSEYSEYSDSMGYSIQNPRVLDTLRMLHAVKKKDRRSGGRNRPVGWDDNCLAEGIIDPLVDELKDRKCYNPHY